ncbi:hypothetical protein GGR38_004117 [Novosphingobium sediminicola]|uniref:Uncharacterized protein n=1 Tax=Novosphingobium sediminicola TaxID=563162 RepID=A0A7W6CMI2_9SPHN|nr:hypothetical protein [Novosphingobium sediminicola]
MRINRSERGDAMSLPGIKTTQNSQSWARWEVWNLNGQTLRNRSSAPT